MKKLFTLCLLAVATLTTAAWAADAPAAKPTVANVVSGEVLEVKNVESYTYLRLKTKDGETWAAVNKATVKKGDKVTVENTMVMSNFESKELKKTFPSIVLGNLGGTTGAKAESSPHSGAAVKPADIGPIKVAKASGANARTVAEIVTKAVELKDKSVKVSGKVVKFNAGIMGKNWVHLQDGTGAAASNTNDILVTTDAQAKVGDVVTVTGTVRNDKDFGAGYSYKVMIEEAILQP